VRRIFIGDIQGCLAQLDALLARIGVRDSDQVFCVGDLVNRGPNSLGVLRRMRDIGATSVLGNHDLALLELGASPRRGALPPALEAVLQAPDCPRQLDWLARQPVLHVDDDLVLVHAGLHPDWAALDVLSTTLNTAVPRHVSGARDARIEFATQVRYCDAAGHRPSRDEPPPPPPYRPWDDWYDGDRIVVFGHWARRGLVNGPRVRGLDTGCVYGGRLTAWIEQEDRFVQVAGWSAPDS